MVLSNKKLKQKLRAELAESSLSKISKHENATNQEPQKSMKQLLESITQKPRLSRREKHRKSLPLLHKKGENEDAHVVEESSRGKKRRRESEEKEGKLEVEVEENGGEAREKKKKKKKDKKKELGENGVKEEGGDLNKEENGGEGREKKKKKDKNELGENGVKEEGGDLNKEEKVSSSNSNKKKKKKLMKKKLRRKKKKEEKQYVTDNGTTDQIVAENGTNSDQIVAENSQGNDGNSKKVYVGGMPYYSTEGDIRSYFDHCGTITDIDCVMFPETGKFRGIAMISFETEEVAKNALELDGSDMGGLYLKIQPYKTTRTSKTSDFSPPVIDGYNRIYAGNLSWDITEEDLRKLFRDCNISSIRFGKDKETGEYKGYAHVDFADNESLNKALKLDQKFVCGRPVKISRAVRTKGVVGQAGSSSTVVEPSNYSGSNPVVTPENPVVTPENNTGISSGKIKRRTCYECGERGHLSSNCPKKQATDQENPTAT